MTDPTELVWGVVAPGVPLPPKPTDTEETDQ